MTLYGKMPGGFAGSLLIVSFLTPLLRTTEAKGASAARCAEVFADGVESVNKAHARKPGKTKEPELARRLPRNAKTALENLLKMKDSPELFDALVTTGKAALDLDLIKDFDRIRARLKKSSPDHAAKLGTATTRPLFLLHGTGGLDRPYLERFAVVLEAVFKAYDTLFGFEEWSKVPGKKVRFSIHRVDRIERPPHFAPQYPYHSEVYFPVVDPKDFKSPTADGKFLFYGLAHELGHVFAMWGDRRNMEDHHAWAHYTGVAVVEHLSKTAGDRPFMKHLRDVRWRSLDKDRQALKGHGPSTQDRNGVLSLLIALHDGIGPKAMGTALNLLDRTDRRLRINKVRYYTFKEFKSALLKTLKSRKAKVFVTKVMR
ncbi:MAG: hypothetical protein ACYTHM_25245 [Planctomycetota bacterium]|jgi:hypothetical protein